MIDIARIDHISMAVAELDPQVELLERLFGFRYTGRFSADGYLGADLGVPGSSGIAWELLAPDRPDSYLHRFLDGVHGPGLHHLGLQVRDMDAALHSMAQFGIEPWRLDQQERHLRTAQSVEDEVAGDAHSVTYIGPRGGDGFLYQLHEAAAWHLSEPFEDDRPGTIGITAVNSLGHAHHNRTELGDWYEQLFGFRTVHSLPLAFARASFVSRILELPSEQLRVEVMQPAREDSFLQRFIDERGSAIHHVSFEVREMQVAIAACNSHRVAVIAEHSGQTEGGRWHEAFIPPEHTGGMLVQFFDWEPASRQPPLIADAESMGTEGPTSDVDYRPAPDEANPSSADCSP